MSPTRRRGLLHESRARAFTLIEIIVAMAIIALIASVAVPTLKGLQEDETTRAPLAALAALVQDVRQRALREHRPFEIVLERSGLHAIPGNRSFPKRDDFLLYLEELRTPPPSSNLIEPSLPEVADSPKPRPVAGPGISTSKPPEPTPNAPALLHPPPDLPWTATIPLAQNFTCEVLLWGDPEWDLLEGEHLRRWVFQPNGMADPLQIRLTSGGTTLEATFDLLTGELTRQRSLPHPKLP